MNVIVVQDSTGAKTHRLLFIQNILKRSLIKLHVKNVEVSVTLISDQTMKTLNKKYRHQNKATDVLSFSQKDMFIGKRRILGDIIIAKETTRKQAKSANHRLKDEYGMLAVHGLLHLLGYDHEKKKDEVVMFGLQKKLLTHVHKI